MTSEAFFRNSVNVTVFIGGASPETAPNCTLLCMEVQS